MNINNKDTIEKIVLDNDLKLSEEILKNCPKSSRIKLWRFSIFHNKIDIFKMCVNDYSFDINTHLEHALIDAIEYGHYKIAKEFIDNENYKINIRTIECFLNDNYKAFVVILFNNKKIFNQLKIKNKDVIKKILLENKIENF
jgi:hypothetical protein